MDNNVEWILEQKVKRTMEALEANNMESYFVKDEKALIEKINEFVKDGETVAVGGSMTLFETGVIDFLRSGRFNFLDRYKENLTAEDTKNIFRKSFMSDTYFVSSNAVTEQGELYNIDGTGNRVAAMIYGPDKVIVIIGVNKIVSNLDEAIDRTRNCAAPANAKRLNRNTPCAKVGYCMDCDSAERICNDYVLIKKQGQKGRIKVIVVGKNLGY